MGTIIFRVEEGYVSGFFSASIKKILKKKAFEAAKQTSCIDRQERTCVSFSFLQSCARTMVRFITFNTFFRHIFMLNTRSTRIGLGLPGFKT